MSGEEKVEGIINGEDLNGAIERNGHFKVAEGVEIDEQIHQQEEIETRRNIEKSMEKIGSHSARDDDKNKKIKKHAIDVSKLDAEGQVEHLVQVAMKEGPVLALEVARELENNYVLAEVYGGLTEDKVRDVLIQKGLLK